MELKESILTNTDMVMTSTDGVTWQHKDTESPAQSCHWLIVVVRFCTIHGVTWLVVVYKRVIAFLKERVMFIHRHSYCQ